MRALPRMQSGCRATQTDENDHAVKRAFMKKRPNGEPLLDGKGRRQIREGGFELETDTGTTHEEHGDLCDFCPSNCVLVHELQVCLQVIGIPMGLEVSVFAAQTQERAS